MFLLQRCCEDHVDIIWERRVPYAEGSGVVALCRHVSLHTVAGDLGTQGRTHRSDRCAAQIVEFE